MSKDTKTAPAGASRRDLLQGAAVAATVAGAAAVTLRPDQAFAAATPGTVLAQAPGARASAARNIRIDSANANFADSPATAQAINNDESTYPDFRGNFSKTLKHDANGMVTRASYLSLLNALNSRNPADFQSILVGRENDPQRNRLVSPQAAFAFELSGLDGNANRINPAPGFASAVTEAEMAELYWYSVTRDVPFIEYETRPIIRRAADDLNTFARKDIFPRNSSGDVTPQTIFRGTQPDANFTGVAPAGALVGPFVSQFLLLPFMIGQKVVDQRYPNLVRGGANQYMTEYQEALAIQRGFDPNANGNATSFLPNQKFISSMRDLSEWVHRDYPLQAGLHALSVVFGFGDDNAFDQSLPYLRVNSATQQGFVNFGLPDISHLVVHAPRQALTGAWFQKWATHRRLRPEAYGIRINRQVTGAVNYGIGAQLLGSEAYQRAVDEVRRLNQTPGSNANDGLLPMGFPEGCPAHPAYPGGHSSFAAAGATVLKAFVNEDYVIPNPMQPNRNGSQLQPWTGAPLTIGGELNKLVANVTHARDGAGMHWRTDGIGNLIGEAVAIALLRDYSRTYNEEISGLTLRKFNGQRIRIANGVVTNI
jgi:membrane-associated phospholipid phosphatase